MSESSRDRGLALLNEYFDVVVDRVTAHGGTVNKFIGDAACCIWARRRNRSTPRPRVHPLEMAAAESRSSEAARLIERREPAVLAQTRVHPRPARS